MALRPRAFKMLPAKLAMYRDAPEFFTPAIVHLLLAVADQSPKFPRFMGTSHTSGK